MDKIFLSAYVVNTKEGDERRSVYGDKWFTTHDEALAHATRKAGTDNDGEHTFFVFTATSRIDVATLPVTVVAL